MPPLLLPRSPADPLPSRKPRLRSIVVPMCQQDLEPVHRGEHVSQLHEIAGLPARRDRTLGQTDLPYASVFKRYHASAIGHLAYGEAEREADVMTGPGASRVGRLGLGGGQTWREHGAHGEHRSKRLHGGILGGLFL